MTNKSKKVTIIYLTEENLSKGTRQYEINLIGDKPSDSLAKRGIEELLKYVKRIREIR